MKDWNFIWVTTIQLRLRSLLSWQCSVHLWFHDLMHINVGRKLDDTLSSDSIKKAVSQPELLILFAFLQHHIKMTARVQRYENYCFDPIQVVFDSFLIVLKKPSIILDFLWPHISVCTVQYQILSDLICHVFLERKGGKPPCFGIIFGHFKDIVAIHFCGQFSYLFETTFAWLTTKYCSGHPINKS